jgi:hypothetical protein
MTLLSFSLPARSSTVLAVPAGDKLDFVIVVCFVLDEPRLRIGIGEVRVGVGGVGDRGTGLFGATELVGGLRLLLLLALLKVEV